MAADVPLSSIGDQVRAAEDDYDSWVDAVLDKDLATPPGSPTAGDRYIVAASPTGAWVGHAAHVATYSGVGWTFLTPTEGSTTWVRDEAKLYTYQSAAWSQTITTGAAPYEAQFDSTDLSGGGVLTVVHGLNTLNPTVVIRDDTGARQGGQDLVVDANTVTIDLSGFGVDVAPWFVKVSQN